MEHLLELLPSELHIWLQMSLIFVPPMAIGFLKLVCGKVDLLIIITLDKSELLLHSLQPMISYHQILSSKKDGWVGLHETMIPTK